jgi:hypothetical protein
MPGAQTTRATPEGKEFLDLCLPVAVPLHPKAVRLAGHGVDAPKSGASAWFRHSRDEML